MSKAANRKDTADLLKEQKKNNKKFYAEIRQQKSGVVNNQYGNPTMNNPGGFSVSGGNTNIDISFGNPLQGGNFVGPIAFNDVEKTISGGKLTIAGYIETPTSYVIVNGESGAADDLTYIISKNVDILGNASGDKGTVFIGQLLFLQAGDANITLKHNTGNIFIPGGTDLVLNKYDSTANTGGAYAILLWDENNVGTSSGRWVLVSSGASTSSSSGATRELDNLQNVAINSDLLFGTTGLDLGNTTNPVDRLYANTVRLQTGTPPTNIVSIGASANDGIMKFGVPTNKWYQWGFGSTPQATYLQEATPQLTIKNPNTVGILLWDTSGNDNEFKIVNQDSNSSTRFSQDYHAAFEFHGNTSSNNGATRMYLIGDGGQNDTFIEFSTSMATANTDIAKINFEGHDSAGNDTSYATIGARVFDPTSGSEGGMLSLEVVENGTERTAYLLCDGVNDEVKIYKPLDMSSQKIENLLTPQSDYDAATKKYVDDNSGGGGGSGANTTLSNLGTTALNAALNMNGQNIQGNGTLNIKGKSDDTGTIKYAAQTHDFEGGSLEDINQITATSSGTRYINNFKGIDFDGTGYIKSDGDSVLMLGNNITFQQAIYSSSNKEIYLNGSSHINFGNGNGDSRPTWKSGSSTDSSLPANPEGKVEIRVGSSTKYVYYYSS